MHQGDQYLCADHVNKLERPSLEAHCFSFVRVRVLSCVPCDFWWRARCLVATGTILPELELLMNSTRTLGEHTKQTADNAVAERATTST